MNITDRITQIREESIASRKEFINLREQYKSASISDNVYRESEIKLMQQISSLTAELKQEFIKEEDRLGSYHGPGGDYVPDWRKLWNTRRNDN